MSDESEDFAAMFEASVQAKRLEEGELVEGKIVAIGPEVALVDVGRKGEAVMEIAELKNAEGKVEVALGDLVQAMVVSTSGGLTLSRKLAGAAASDRQFEAAFRSGLPVEGKVEREIKGGYEVRIGRRRAFCPISQIDHRGASTSAHDGHVYQFRIIEYKEEGANIVVSRRALLEDEQRANAAKVREKIVPGAVMTGRVASVREFGAFVDLGAGVQGLLHVSDMAWSRVSNPAEIVKAGDEITVKLLRVDEEKHKISLGLKQLSADPWSRVGEVYKVGQQVPGRVTRVAQFGAFVELEPGVEALAHASTFEPTGRPEGWAGQVAPGMTATFEILAIDPGQKRIGVALVQEAWGPAAEATGARPDIVPGARLKGKVERHEKFGVFVFLAPGRTGVIPPSETGVEKEADLRRVFPVGADVEVIVLEVDPSGRRIRLSAKAVMDAREAAEVREWTERNAPSAEGLGTLAEKLRSALKAQEGETIKTEQTTSAGTDANRVCKVVSVPAPQEVAWRVFTEKMGTWWPLAMYKIGKVNAVDALIEPRVGGRWYERGDDGSTCDWGSVAVWEPHSRLVLYWEITADWQHDPSLKTELELRFIAEGKNATRVELEHRRLDLYGARRDEMRRIFDTEGDWGRFLAAFAQTARATSD